ncbi:hypothetical protein DER45DRAFT_541062 [Fusarium avenaceum]|nr:hypothetical protein DER45DRAFT_541062 [Fusarium avenaceum]
MLKIIKDARTMKRLMEKTLDRRINPFNVAPKGPRQDQQGREHPGDQPSHFELTGENVVVAAYNGRLLRGGKGKPMSHHSERSLFKRVGRTTLERERVTKGPHRVIKKMIRDHLGRGMRDTGKPEAYQTILVGVDSQLPGRLGSSSGSYPAKPTGDPTPSIRDVTNLPRVDHRHQAGGVNRHWMLTVVPLSAYSILVELVTRLKVLLAANNLDSMSMNTAIQAVSLYVQIKSASDLDAETLASYDRKSPPKALSNRASHPQSSAAVLSLRGERKVGIVGRKNNNGEACGCCA